MIRKKSKKIFCSILIISICSCLCISTPVYAWAQGITQATGWLKNTKTSGIINKKSMFDLLDNIYGILIIILVVLLIFRGIFLGLKMIYGTTVEERVDVKKMTISYIKFAFAVGFGGVFIKAFFEFVWTLF